MSGSQSPLIPAASHACHSLSTVYQDGNTVFQNSNTLNLPL
jgi:hypothetical protein